MHQVGGLWANGDIWMGREGNNRMNQLIGLFHILEIHGDELENEEAKRSDRLRRSIEEFRITMKGAEFGQEGTFSENGK